MEYKIVQCTSGEYIVVNQKDVQGRRVIAEADSHDEGYDIINQIIDEEEMADEWESYQD